MQINLIFQCTKLRTCEKIPLQRLCRKQKTSFHMFASPFETRMETVTKKFQTDLMHLHSNDNF